MHEQEEMTLEEAITAYAELFEEYPSEHRIKALNYANSLIVDREIDALSAFKVLTTFNVSVHGIIGGYMNESHDQEGMVSDVDLSFVGHGIAQAWCGIIESSFLKPVICALAVEVQHRLNKG